ncbi:uncharacterized protein ARMOST_14959 [Armillaria ostoyae]|uniref:Uncharacterized protein n=1 Tax=Armillaria ostoyae TaxID=47428 RepID=A0A284RS19_ARMOS|nr:uncharacterized protein ARMOST_14959 [Armillaria ostoyae]
MVAASTWAYAPSPPSPTSSTPTLVPSPTHRFITIVPDYCLVDSGVQFPGAAQDARDAIQRATGAMNVLIILALPKLYSPTLHPRIKGAVLLSGSYTFENMPADRKDSVGL